MMVIDSSIILAIYFDEPTSQWAAEELNKAQRRLMSTVNLAECLIRVRDRQPNDKGMLLDRLRATGVEFVAPDAAQAVIAAHARSRYPLNLGDCFAYALAKAETLPLLTLDQDFKRVDVPVILPPAK